MRFMCVRLRKGGAPSEIVEVYRAEDARRGRNEPRSSGFGLKWKHCHGVFFFGSLFPILWIFGAFMRPPERVAQA